ncbi:MAG: phage major capsid protein [Anaerolineae bacterium]
MTVYNSVVSRVDAGALIPEDAAREILNGVIEGSAIMRMGFRAPDMARAQRRVPVLSTLPTGYFVNGDTGLKQTTSAAWANKYFNAEEIAVVIPISKAVLDDTDYDLWAQIKPLLVAEFGRVFDAAVLFGTNAPASWPDDLLTGATAAGNTITAGGVGADLYDDLLGVGGVISLAEADGYMVNGHIAALAMRAMLRGLRSTDGTPLFVRSMQGSNTYELDGSPIIFPLNGAMDAAQALMFSGDWSKVVWTLRQDMTYTIATEGVISGDNGAIVLNLFQQDSVALRAVMRVAWQVENPINRIQGTEANRYPVAVLLPA